MVEATMESQGLAVGGSDSKGPGPEVIRDRKVQSFYDYASRLWGLGLPRLMRFSVESEFRTWLRTNLLEQFIKADGPIIVLPVDVTLPASIRTLAQADFHIIPFGDIVSRREPFAQPRNPYVVSGMERIEDQAQWIGVSSSGLTMVEVIYSKITDPLREIIVTTSLTTGGDPISVSSDSGSWIIRPVNDSYPIIGSEQYRPVMATGERMLVVA